ncbi:MAG: hypothetical protein Q4B30_06640 [Coriobacteriaceae bacterium]|nr:hypothetical protein [Coriobacteriaceae bacterium]
MVSTKGRTRAKALFSNEAYQGQAGAELLGILAAGNDARITNLRACGWEGWEALAAVAQDDFIGELEALDDEQREQGNTYGVLVETSYPDGSVEYAAGDEIAGSITSLVDAPDVVYLGEIEGDLGLACEDADGEGREILVRGLTALGSDRVQDIELLGDGEDALGNVWDNPDMCISLLTGESSNDKLSHAERTQERGGVAHRGAPYSDRDEAQRAEAPRSTHKALEER